MATSSPKLSLDQKRSLYHDGFVILRNAVAPELVEAALKRMKNARKGENLGPSAEMTGLVNASSITPILTEALGNFDPPVACQVGVLKRRDPGDHYNNLGYKDKDQPYFGAETHIDGMITMAAPQEVQEGSAEEIYHRYFASGPKGELGRSADVIGANMVPLFEDREMTLALGSFNAFIFVCLNDQLQEGQGQTAVIPGGHHAVEKFLQKQRGENNHIGPEGPGWPRMDHNAPNRAGLVYTPDEVREQFIDETSESTPDGKKWPRPTQVLMHAGDACIAMYQIPHSGTRNEFGTESRKNIIFRIRNKSRQPNVKVNGVTDHPDRGQMGEWLEFEAGNDPFERSKHFMCNMWDEWEGMQEVVAEEKSKLAAD